MTLLPWGEMRGGGEGEGYGETSHCMIHRHRYQNSSLGQVFIKNPHPGLLINNLRTHTLQYS